MSTDNRAQQPPAPVNPIAAERYTTVRNAAVTAFDQGALSAVNFAVGLAFIYRGTPEQYGLFTLYMSIYYLLAAAQNAMVNAPLMVMLPRMTAHDRLSFESGIGGILLLGMLAAIPAVSLGSLLPTTHRGAHATDFIVVAVCCLPLTLRDFFRAQEYAHIQPANALRRDLGYTAFALLGVGILSMSRALRGLTAFGALSVASSIIVLPGAIALGRSLPTRQQIIGAFQVSWVHSRWSALGAMSSWLQTNAFVFIPFFIAGSREVAFLAAARMVFTPMTLLAQSWSNYFRPHASKLLAAHDQKAALRLFAHSLVALTGILVFYTAAAALLFTVVPSHWIPAAYHGMNTYIALWAAVTLVQILRTNVSSLLQASLAFRGLGLAAFGVAITVVAASIPLVRQFGGGGSLIAVLGGEVLLTVLLVWLLHRIVGAHTYRDQPATVAGA